MEKETRFSMMDTEMPDAGFINKATNFAISFLSFILWCHSWISVCRDLYICFRYLFRIISHIVNFLKNCFYGFPDFCLMIYSNISSGASYMISVCNNRASHISYTSFILWTLSSRCLIKLLKDFNSFFPRLLQISLFPFFYTPLNVKSISVVSYSKSRRYYRACVVDQKMPSSLVITGEDIAVVMENLGLFQTSESKSWLEIGEVFDENEPSLDEVREAFDLFDRNNDGFIDAEELMKALSTVGFTGFSKQECQTMIMAFDENGDGRIDVREFIKLMEACFCD